MVCDYLSRDYFIWSKSTQWMQIHLAATNMTDGKENALILQIFKVN